MILPADWPAGDGLRAVLLHEYAHVVRRDPRWRLLQRLVGALFWFHPGVLMLNRRLDAAREDVCDNHALLAAAPVDYAETLLTAARFCRPGRTPSGSLTMFTRRTDLERRVRDLLDPRRDARPRLPRRQRLALAGALALAMLAVPSVGLRRVAYAGQRADLTTPGLTFAPPDGGFVIPDLVAGQALQVIVEAEGYDRLTPADPAKRFTLRGKLLNSRGDGVSGAELRLIASDPNRPAKDMATSWIWIENDQIATAASTRQLQKGVTASDGGFEFRGVPTDAAVQLAYWGPGIPRGRVERIERLPASEREALTVNVPAAATVAVAVDRAAIPGVNSVQMSLVGSLFVSYDAKPTGGAGYVVGDLPAGNYTLTAYAAPQPIEGSGGFTLQVLATKTVTVKAGDVRTVELGAADRVPKP